MKRFFTIAMGVLLLCASATANNLLNGMKICVFTGPGCERVPLSPVPTLPFDSVFLTINGHKTNSVIFGTFNGFVIPADDVWTLAVTVSWDETSVSRQIVWQGDGVTDWGIAAQMGIPDSTQFPRPSNTMFTLDTVMTDSRGHIIDSATDHFILSLPEDSSLLLLSIGSLALAAFREVYPKYLRK